MPISFPVAEDIRLLQAPLREVICQVRFPMILRMAEELPSKLQDRVRDRFPLFDIERPIQMSVDETPAADKVQLLPPVFRFHSPSRTETLSLAVDFYALSCTRYEHWESFAETLDYVSKAIHQIYGISQATRIGLRYINFIDQRFWPSEDDLFLLIRPELTTMLRSDFITPPVTSFSQVSTAFGDGYLTFRYGLVQGGETPEYGFVLDFDAYAENVKLSLEDLVARCAKYHQIIYNAFRWCIPPERLSEFGPVNKEADQ